MTDTHINAAKSLEDAINCDLLPELDTLIDTGGGGSDFSWKGNPTQVIYDFISRHRDATIERLTSMVETYHDERQQLREILCVSMPAVEGTSAAEFDPQLPLVDSAKRLTADLAAANEETSPPSSEQVKELRRIAAAMQDPMGVDPEAEHILSAAATIERLEGELKAKQPSAIEGNNEPCDICGEKCSAHAGNPSRWPSPVIGSVPGKIAWAHIGCIHSLRTKLEAAEKVENEAANLLTALLIAVRVLRDGNTEHIRFRRGGYLDEADAWLHEYELRRDERCTHSPSTIERLEQNDDCKGGVSGCRNMRRMCRTCQVEALQSKLDAAVKVIEFIKDQCADPNISLVSTIANAEAAARDFLAKREATNG